MQRSNARITPRQSPRSAPYAVRSGLPSSPGSATGLELNAAVTSRKWRPSPKPEAGHTVTIIDGIFRFDGAGSFDGTGTTWGTAKFIELFTNADNDEYSKDRVVRCFINLVEYDFVVTTKAAPVGTEAVNPDDSDMLNPDASQAYNPL
jgi:hypothetical protein